MSHLFSTLIHGIATLFLISALALPSWGADVAEANPKPLRAGIIGLDTSHVIAFTKSLNDPKVGPELAGCKVVAAYPKGSPDIESSVKRVPGYTKEMQEMRVEIVDSIDELLKRVDVVFLETNDGRPHLEQVLPVFAAKKPVFIDKPIAASLEVTRWLFSEHAKEAGVPMFSSSLRCAMARIRKRSATVRLVRLPIAKRQAPRRWKKRTPIYSGTAFTESNRSSPSWEQVANRSNVAKLAGRQIEVVGQWSDGRNLGTFSAEGKGYVGIAGWGKRGSRSRRIERLCTVGRRSRKVFSHRHRSHQP